MSDPCWQTLEVPGLAEGAEAAVPRQACIFAHCDDTHKGVGVFNCHECGGTADRSCVRKELPPQKAEEFLEQGGEDGWVCPPCAWAKATQKAADAANDAADDDGDAPGAAEETDPFEGEMTLADMKAWMRKTQKRVDALEAELKTMRTRQDRADEDLPASFSAHVVPTWRPTVETPHGRRLIKSELSRVFREAEIQEGTEEPERTMRNCFERIREVFGYMQIDGADPEQFMTPLHNIVCELSSAASLKGEKPRGHYESRAKSTPLATFTRAAYRKIMGEAKAIQLEAEKKREEHRAKNLENRWRSEGYTPYPTAGKGKGKGKGKGSKSPPPRQ
eukprot:TRINITY_DN1808_c0_g2_i1.p2 TRINITY_DN1808_c0_g2~~TRINITY_DN1808_c0_g2_i1.p2  ORF type:complete len:333 (+),score=48.04 TRINITY_DN1808_c0_g2_i1:456-1454(+)